MSSLRQVPRKEWWEEYWHGMPGFVQEDMTSKRMVEVRLRSPEDWEAFGRLVGQEINLRERYIPSIWYPEAEIGSYAGKAWVLGPDKPPEWGLPRWPVYVPTKGRWERPLTIRALERCGIPFYAVVEAQEAEHYAAVLQDPSRMLILPHRDKGLVVTRNWIWDHAEASGAEWFWTFDDNIQGFYRLHYNLKTPLRTGAMLRAIENFAARYENVPIAGMHYFMFASRKHRWPPLYLNTRVYSNMLIRTNAVDPKTDRPFRNEGFFNDDTDLCLRALKAGYCTALFNAFLILKQTTMKVKGGLTPYYQGDGRWKMARELQLKHPDVTTVTKKWGRWQHHVNYEPFSRNQLRPIPGVEIPPGADEHGMALEVDGKIVKDPAAHLPSKKG